MCQVFDFNDYFDLEKYKPLKLLIFASSKKTSNALTFHIEDQKTMLTKRPLKSSVLSYTGPLIFHPYLVQRKVMKVIIKLSQIISVAEDEGCISYPNKNHNSYRICDENFIFDYTKQNFNLTPFWATDSFEKISNTRLLFIYYVYQKLV